MRIWRDPLAAKIDELEASNKLLRKIVLESLNNQAFLAETIATKEKISTNFHQRILALENRAGAMITATELMQLFPEKFS